MPPILDPAFDLASTVRNDPELVRAAFRILKGVGRFAIAAKDLFEGMSAEDAAREGVDTIEEPLATAVVFLEEYLGRELRVVDRPGLGNDAGRPERLRRQLEARSGDEKETI